MYISSISNTQAVTWFLSMIMIMAIFMRGQK